MEKLSEKDKGLIRDSWESLGKNKVPHGIVMFTRLFELDPALLTLFSYSTNCGVAPECLSSPQFLEHVTKSHIDHLGCLICYWRASSLLPLFLNSKNTKNGLAFSWRPVLPGDLERTQKDVMLVIDAAVSHLDDLHTLEDFLLNLGRKHQAVGVKTQSFAMVGESLLYMLQSSLGPAYTTPLRQAWLNMYSIVVSAMTRGWAKNGEHKSN